MKFTEDTKQHLRSIIDKSAASEDGIPGTTVVLVGNDGSEPFVHSAGKRGVAGSEKMTPDNIYWIASCTKMVTGLSCMQLVEKGIMKLDDSEWLENLCPELRDLQVLTKSGKMEPKRNGITLEMLLTHTAGFGYTFFNERLRDWGAAAGLNEFSGNTKDVLHPLLFQPGEGWEYGVGIDWAGIALERASGMRLNEYMQKNVCQPLGLTNVNMIPTASMKENLAKMHQRSPEGKLTEREHLHARPLQVQTADEKEAVFHSGGAGLFAKPEEYSRIIAVLLNNGTCPRTGAKLLEKSTVDDMFTNHAPKFPQFGRQGIPAAIPDLTNPLADLYPTEGNSPQGWGLTFMLTGGATGRSSSTGWWAGLANLFWWADRENGIGGIVCSQILPFGDPKVMGMWVEVEAAAYQALKA